MVEQPGCYGSPLCCRATQSPCNVCPLFARCAVEASGRARRFKSKYGLDAFVGLNKPSFKPTGEIIPKPVANKKALELVGVLARKKIDVRGALMQGQNPFMIEPPAYMRIAVDQLLLCGIERPALKQRFIRELRWSDVSAASHVGIASGALLELGVAQRMGERLVRA